MFTELTLPVAEVIVRTKNVKSVRLKVDANFCYKAGQYLFVEIPSDKKLGKPLSFSSSPTEKGYIEVTKKLTGSDFSLAFDRLKRGDALKIRYPFGNFTYEDRYPKIALVSGGIGITPLRSIAKYIVDAALGTDVILLYGNNTKDDIVFEQDLIEMQGKDPRVKVVHVLLDAGPQWRGRSGLITGSLIREEIPDHLERRFYLCGPAVMVEGMKKILLDNLRMDKAKIIAENFSGY